MSLRETYNRDGHTLGIARFQSVHELLDVIKKRGWENRDHKGDGDEWTYGEHYTTREETIKALSRGACSEEQMDAYQEQRDEIERTLRISRFIGKGLSCKRRRRDGEDGDELNIDKVMAGRDDYWTVIKRDAKSKNIRIGLNFGLACGNSERDFARLGGVLALLSDILTRLGYAVEIIGLQSVDYRGKGSYDEVVNVIPFKSPNERLDIQRLLSMTHQGLHRDLLFGVLDRGWGINRGSYGCQTVTSEHARDRLGLSYIIEQKSVHTENSTVEFFERVIFDLVDKRGYLG